MLNEDELTAYMDRLGLSEEARRAIRTIRSSEPSRNVKSGKGNVSCKFPSEKVGVTIQAESHTVELAAVYEWEHDPDVLEFWDQTPKIKVIGRRNERKYSWRTRPDYFLLHKDWAGWVECKAESFLLKRCAPEHGWFVRHDDGRWTFPPGEAYAAEMGLRFVVRSSAETDWVSLRNQLLLADYRANNCPPLKAADKHAALNKLAQQPWWILRDFIHADPPVAADVAFKLIADGLVHVDLAQELLAEPELVHVFRDEASALAHKDYLRAMTVGGPMPPAIIARVEGQPLLWDGKPWRIVNPGTERITIRSDEGRLEALLNEDFEKLVLLGAITCPDGPDTEREHLRHERSASASPEDLELARNRYYNLFPEVGTPKRKYGERMLTTLRSLYRSAEETLGNGFLGLIPKIHERGNRTRKIPEAAIEIMRAVIKEKLSDGRRGGIYAAWGEVGYRCTKAGLKDPPCEKTFRIEVKHFKRDAERTADREGDKAAYSKTEFCWKLEHASPRHGDMPYAIGHIDHTELDIQIRGRRFREEKMRLWLSVLIDAYTRKVLAYYLSFDKPSYRSCMCVIRDCVRRGHRVPSVIVVDKGAEFLSGYFDLLLARLKVTKKVRPTASGRFGSLIERFFGLTNQEFIHQLWGNTQASRDPRRTSATHDPRALAVWDVESFNDAFEGFIEHGYGDIEHSALGMSPNAAMQAGIAMFGHRTHKLQLYDREFIIWTLPTTSKGKAKVQSGRGVKINYLYYWNDAFRSPKLEGTAVPVRFNPFDVSHACAYVEGRWIDLKSEYSELFKGRSDREIRLISAEIRERHAKTHIRHGINAALIAAYIREASQTEAVMQQRVRDSESNAINTTLHAVPKASGVKQHMAEPEISVSDAPDLPEPAEKETWFDYTLLDRPIKDIGDF